MNKSDIINGQTERFSSVEGFAAALAADFGPGTEFRRFLMPDRLIAGGAGLRFSYSPYVGVGTVDVLRPFPGVMIMLYEGRYDRADRLNAVAKKLQTKGDRYMIRMVLEGEMVMRFGDRLQTITKGGGLVYAYPDTEDMDLWPKAGCDHRYVHMIFTEKGLKRASQALRIVTPSAFLALPHVQTAEERAIQDLRGPALEHFAESLWLHQGPAHLQANWLQHKIGELFCLLSTEEDCDFNALGQSLPPAELRKFRELLGILDARFTAPPTLEQLSRQVGLNRRKLTEGFRLLHGVSIGDYCQGKRLALARELLETSDSSVAEIAAQCGYEHTGNFSRIFRKRFGKSPRDMR